MIPSPCGSPWPRRLRALVLALLVLLAPGPVARAQEEGGGSPLFGLVEAFVAPERASEAGTRWERVMFLWPTIQPDGPESWLAPGYFPLELVDAERAAGREVVGLLLGTPAWAASDPADGTRAVPRNLDLPVEDPANYWAAFTYRLAGEYRGRIDHWIVWNEPEFRGPDEGGDYYTWAGSPEEFYRLVKVADQAIKRANPGATVVVGATSWWVDVIRGRPQFLERVLEAQAADPQAAEHGPSFDAVALNLYYCPDDLHRIAAELRALLARHGLAHLPIWLTETNAMPTDDPGFPSPPASTPVTQEEQAAFIVQALAMGAAAGFARVAVNELQDDPDQDRPFGLLRGDGSPRPAFTAYAVAARWLAGASRVTFLPVERPAWPWPAGGYQPNWMVYAVVFDRPGERVTVLWNGDGEPRTVALVQAGPVARLIDARGNEEPLPDAAGRWEVALPGATARRLSDPKGYHFIGGEPLLVVEQEVPADAPLAPPALLPPLPPEGRAAPLAAARHERTAALRYNGAIDVRLDASAGSRG